MEGRVGGRAKALGRVETEPLLAVNKVVWTMDFAASPRKCSGMSAVVDLFAISRCHSKHLVSLVGDEFHYHWGVECRSSAAEHHGVRSTQENGTREAGRSSRFPSIDRPIHLMSDQPHKDAFMHCSRLRVDPARLADAPFRLQSMVSPLIWT